MWFTTGVIFALALVVSAEKGGWYIGTGIADITGPAVEIGFLGYCASHQKGAGIHTRMRSRAFIFAESNPDGKRVVIVTAETGMAYQLVKLEVVKRLQAIYDEKLYTDDNVLIASTHTHSTPGGTGGYIIYDLNAHGFNRDYFDSTCEGIVRSIQKAHEQLRPAKALWGQGYLHDSNINRSPLSYLLNPVAERASWKENTDHMMSLIRMDTREGDPIGMLNWFGVHGTSLNNTNVLISGDNKGYASIRFEKLMQGKNSIPGQAGFVAAFAQTNEGDMSPNTLGASCPDGSPCDEDHSTCGGRSQGCIGKGPGKDQFESAAIIGEKQYRRAVELYREAARGADLSLSGPIDYRQEYVDMRSLKVSADFTSTGRDEKTCTPALGFGFAAGTTDGPGQFDFIQGDEEAKTNKFWHFMRGFLSTPTKEQQECHEAKEILVNAYNMKPGMWAPHIIPIQVLRLGRLLVLGFPGELTTMGGRRLRAAVHRAAQAAGMKDEMVVIAGLANSYSFYCATYEEYQKQRYEGAATLYGPHTLSAYLQEFSKLATAVVTGQEVEHGPSHPTVNDMTLFSFVPPVIMDCGDIGTVLSNAKPRYKAGEQVDVTFWGANLRSDYMTEGSYMTVERLAESTKEWKIVCTDGCWETKVIWRRVGICKSSIQVHWDIPADVEPGTYRIQHFGYAKKILSSLTPYQVSSSTFLVVNPSLNHLRSVYI